MEIRRVVYQNVYGALSGELNFTQGENFLVGINGCGKTTVLNIIRWTLGPSLPDLCTLHHDLIRITIKHKNYLYVIQSRFYKGRHELNVITKDKARDFKPIRTQLAIDPRNSPIHQDRAELHAIYRHLSPEPHEVSTWRFLNEEVPAPVFIGLERSVGGSPVKRNIRSNRLPLDDSRESTGRSAATTLMRDAFNTSRQRLVELNDELNRKVLELSFDQVLSRKLFKAEKTSKDTLQKIEKLKARFEDIKHDETYSRAFSTKEVRQAIVSFLHSLSSLLNSKDKADDVWITLNYQNVERAAKMFDLFTKYEVKEREAQLEIVNFSTAVNQFIGDSGKSIDFDGDTGVPFFNSTLTPERLSLSELSSGEVQIVVLLSYFAFLAKKGIPIVIDEPELSLHVQWQRLFVGAVKQVMPPECQTLMATHSPEICGAENVNVQGISVRVKK